MGAILDRLRGILDRSRRLEPLAEPVRQILLDANRARALQGVDYNGIRYALLKPATLKDRAKKGYPLGPPLVRQGENARVIRGCVVTVTPRDGQLRFTKYWKDDWMRFHIEGTAKMARRDPAGWSLAELEAARKLLPRHVLGRPQ